MQLPLSLGHLSFMEAMPLVVQPVQMLLIQPNGAHRALAAELRYDAADPYAVHAAFHGPVETVCWTFARELLANGIRQRCGEGDIRVQPAPDAFSLPMVEIKLASNDGTAIIHVSADILRRFLFRTNLVVPPGTESRRVDLDTFIQSLHPDL